MPNRRSGINAGGTPRHRFHPAAVPRRLRVARPPPRDARKSWNQSAYLTVLRQDFTAATRSRAPRAKGSAMYSIFYIIGLIVVILAVLQLIA